jgi:hypothetical protein
MRDAVRCPRCPESRAATTDGSGGNGPRCPLQVPPPSDLSREVAAVGGHRPLARPPSWNHPRRCPPTGPLARLLDTTADARPPQRSHCRWPLCGTCVGHPTGDAARVGHPLSAARPADRSVSQARRPADMTVEAAAEGRSGSAQAAVMAPVAGHLTAAGPTPSLDTPSARRTTWPHTGQDARSSGRSIRRSLRLVTTSSTLLQGRPLPAADSGGRPRPATTRQPLRNPSTATTEPLPR